MRSHRTESEALIRTPTTPVMSRWVRDTAPSVAAVVAGASAAAAARGRGAARTVVVVGRLMTNCGVKTSRCSPCRPSTEAQDAANAPGASADATSACAQSRKVLRGRPTPATTALSPGPTARHRQLQHLRPLQARGDPHRIAIGEAAATRLKAEMAGSSKIFLDHRLAYRSNGTKVGKFCHLPSCLSAQLGFCRSYDHGSPRFAHMTVQGTCFGPSQYYTEIARGK